MRPTPKPMNHVLRAADHHAADVDVLAQVVVVAVAALATTEGAETTDLTLVVAVAVTAAVVVATVAAAIVHAVVAAEAEATTSGFESWLRCLAAVATRLE